MGASSGAPLFRQVVACPTGQVDVPTAPGSAQAHGADDSLRAHAWCSWTSRCAHGPCQRPPGHSASAEVAVVDGALRLPEAPARGRTPTRLSRYLCNFFYIGTRSPNRITNWLSAAFHSGIGWVHFFATCCSPI